MDTQNTDKPAFDEEDLEGLTQESEKSRKLKANMIVRVVGFVLLFAALVLMVLWQKGVLTPIFQMVAYVIGGAGVVLYLAGRIFSYQKPYQSRRR